MQTSSFIRLSLVVGLAACAGRDPAPTATQPPEPPAPPAEAPATAPATTATPPPGPEAGAVAAIEPQGLLAHVRTLASDEFEGRAPGTPGEQKTIDYLVEQVKKLGLQPGTPEGYVQDVPLIGVTSKGKARFKAGKETVQLRLPQDGLVGTSRTDKKKYRVNNSEVVFVGYGAEAPEYDWDDFKGLDVKGKTIVVLVNDPPVPDPKDPSKLDESVFRGKAMTYYGRWTYKFETAGRKGAAAVLVVHETGPAGYPWEVLSGGYGREDFKLAASEAPLATVEGWLTVDAARRLFKAAGQDYDALKEAARKRDFKPVSLGAKATFTVNSKLRKLASRNVVARLEGTDPERKDETVLYSAHWDHLGRDPSIKGDGIYNGALDNASGTGAVLTIAEAFTRLSKKPARSVHFVWFTAEESGLLGAKHFAAKPPIPPAKMAAVINLDVVNPYGPTRDLVLVGLGLSTLDETFTEVAKAEERVIVGDPQPEKGGYYRSDHFELAKVGVPGIRVGRGTQFVGEGAADGRAKLDEYTARDYHKPSDEVKPDWTLAGAVTDLRTLFRAGYRLAEAPEMPRWKEGAEFKAVRERATVD